LIPTKYVAYAIELQASTGSIPERDSSYRDGGFPQPLQASSEIVQQLDHYHALPIALQLFIV
jgi:hypothetical protein